MADPAWTQLGEFVATVMFVGLLVFLLVDAARSRRKIPPPSASSMPFKPEHLRVTIGDTTWGSYKQSDGSWRILSDRRAARERWSWDALDE